MTLIEAVEAVIDLIEMGGVVGQADIVKCLRTAIAEAKKQAPVPWSQALESVWAEDDTTPPAAPVQPEQEPVAHCEAGPEFCPVCWAETRSSALAAAVGYIQRNTPTLVWTEICRALDKSSPAAPAPSYIKDDTRNGLVDND
jgi:hypothetical protein